MSNVRTGTGAGGSPEKPRKSGESLVRIGELARRAGIPAATLRAWERRYGVVVPRRGSSGYRLYSAAEESRLREMLGLIESGLAPAEAAQRIGAPNAPGETPPEEALGVDGEAALPEVTTRDLLLALREFDGEAAERLLDRAAGSLSVAAFISEVVLPVLRDVGERWARGDADISEEHFASALIRGRLLGLARGWDAGSGPRVVLACPPGERHDLGVLSFGLVLRAHGWRISFLGADTPPEAVSVCVEKTSPDLVVLFAMEAEGFELMEADLAAIAAESPLRLAGPGALPDLCARVGAELLAGDPVHAAETVLAG